jgi:hypothetical protein
LFIGREISTSLLHRDPRIVALVGLCRGQGRDHARRWRFPGRGRWGGGVTFNLDAAINKPDTRKADLPPDTFPFKVDENGNAICLAILSLGQPAHYGNQSGNGDSTDAFQTFMNTYTQNANTGTTSTMTMIKTFTPLTDGLLNQYNVVILQALEDSEYTGLWTYTQSDTDALAKWVKAGGALITMTGYGGNSDEVTPLNQLLSFSGISYVPLPDTFTACPDNMCYCAYSAIGFDGWTTDYADYDQLTRSLKKVGVFHGRAINCSDSSCQIFAKDATQGNVGVAKVIENGHVLAWGDEWVTYTSQWGLVDGQYDDAATYPQCVPYTPKNSYSVPQFWYNVFRWSVPSMQWCFTITVPPTADPGQQIIY